MNRLRISIIIALVLLMSAVAPANGHKGYSYATVTPTTVAPGDYITINFQYTVSINDGGSNTSLWAVFFDGVNGQFPYNSGGVLLAEDTPPVATGTIYEPLLTTITVSNLVVQIPETAVPGEEYPINIFSCASSIQPVTAYMWYGEPPQYNPIMVTIEQENPVIPVDIDIKPYTSPNYIILRSWGTVPVAIFSSEDFDATTVDPATVDLAGAGVSYLERLGLFVALKYDVNGDGLRDLVCGIEIADIDPGQVVDGYAYLVGSTYDGQEIEGSDEVTLIQLPW